MIFLLFFPAICGTIVVVLAGIMVADSVRRRNAPPASIIARPMLLSDREQAVFASLRETLPACYQVCAKVCAWDVVRYQPEGSSENGTERERLKSQHLDFVVVDASDSSIVCVIDLEEEPGSDRERVEWKHQVFGALAAAKIPAVRVPSDARWNAEIVATLLGLEDVRVAA